MTGEHDLAGLIDDASKAISGEQRKHTRKPGSRAGQPAARNLVYLTLIPVALFTFISQFSSNEIVDIRVETELINILHSAQNSIRIYTAENGSLPAALPNASMAAVVNYTIDSSMGRDNYLLSTSSHGITVTMNSLGNITTDIAEE